MTVQADQEPGPAPAAVLRDWRAVLLRPGAATFAAVAAGADWSRAVVAVGVPSVIAGLIRLVQPGDLGGPILAFLAGAAASVVLFSLWAGWFWGAARLLGGQAAPVAHMYALALVWPVLDLLIAGPRGGSDLWGVTACLWVPAAGYGLALTYAALRGVHGLTDTTARLAVMSPLVVAFVGGLVVWAVLVILNPAGPVPAGP